MTTIDSGNSVIDLLKRLKFRNESIALSIVDQQMPQMTGVDFLEQAMEIFPDIKRVLLTAYADTDAAKIYKQGKNMAMKLSVMPLL